MLHSTTVSTCQHVRPKPQPRTTIPTPRSPAHLRFLSATIAGWSSQCWLLIRKGTRHDSITAAQRKQGPSLHSGILRRRWHSGCWVMTGGQLRPRQRQAGAQAGAWDNGVQGFRVLGLCNPDPMPQQAQTDPVPKRNPTTRSATKADDRPARHDTAEPLSEPAETTHTQTHPLACIH